MAIVLVVNSQVGSEVQRWKMSQCMSYSKQVTGSAQETGPVKLVPASSRWEALNKEVCRCQGNQGDFRRD